MNIKERLNSIRIKPNSQVSIQDKIIYILIIFVFGFGLGFLAKYVESVGHFGTVGNLLNLFSRIGTQIDIWVFISTIIAVFSRTPKAGAVHVFSFFVGMLIAYYGYSTFLFGFFPKHYFIAWGIFALFSPICGYIIWYGRGNGCVSIFCASLPIGLLLSQGYTFYYTFSILQGLDLIMALVLFIIISKTWIQRVYILPFAVAVCFAIKQFDVLSYLFGGL
jgi:hypothetical protein